MNSTLTCSIEPSTSMSKLSSSSDIQIIKSLFSDSLTVMSLELLGNPLCQTREREETIFMLSNEDRDCFLDTLKNPPKPNQKLKDAFNFYQDTKFKDV
jgi:hypothetical protein